MREFVRGQKAKLADLTGENRLTFVVEAALESGGTLDVCCAGLNEAGKLEDERYFIYSGRSTSPCEALRHDGAGAAREFSCDLARLPGDVRRIALTLSADGADLARLVESRLLIRAGGREIMRFTFSGADFRGEKAIVIAELYWKDLWRLAAVGAGYQDGLPALAKQFGWQSLDRLFTRAPEAARPVPAGSAPAAPGKVTLEKKGEKKAVDLRKDAGPQVIHFNLNWDGLNPQGKTWFARTQQADLDLGCMYVMKDGSMGVIQPIGGNFGAIKAPPYIYLDKDDRSGAANDGENLYLYRPDLIRFVMVFAFIYEGAQDFSQVGGRMTIRDHSGNEVFIHLSSPDPQLGFCSICTIENVGNHVEIVKEERYFQDHGQADKYYGFGFSWTSGAK